MPVTEFECAIAKSQITRFIAGDSLGDQVVKQLESHIAGCDNCKKLLADKRQALMNVVNAGPSETPAVVSATPRSIPMVETPITASGSEIAPRTHTPQIVDAPTFGGTETMAAPKAFAPATSISIDPSMEPTEAEVNKVKAELREKFALLKNREAKAEAIEVASAETTAMMAESPAKTPKVKKAKPEKVKREFKNPLAALALYRKVSTNPDAPVNKPKETLAQAKEAFKANNSNFRKPMIYAGALAAVIGTMSFFLRDPMSVLGPKAQENLLVKKAPSKNPAKKPIQKNSAADQWKKVRNPKANGSKASSSKMKPADKGTQAQSFAGQPFVATPAKASKLLAKPAPKIAAKTTAKIGPVIIGTKTPTKVITKPITPISPKPTKVATAVKTNSSKPTQKSAKAKRRNRSNYGNGLVRVYGADGKPIR